MRPVLPILLLLPLLAPFASAQEGPTEVEVGLPSSTRPTAARSSRSLSRERFSTAIKTILPPVAFVLVASLQFFIHPSKWNNRLALGTGMLISSVMFHISQTVALPPMARLILFDKVMIAVYLFVVGSLTVTTLIAIDEDYWKGSDHTQKINLYGAAATILVAGATLVLLVGS